jgi:hypothetical protein
VPAVALLELVAHVWQVGHVVTADNWRAAHDEVKKIAQPGDLLAFAPGWTDPLGREFFADLDPMAMAARPDDTRYPRAIEVSIRGKRDPELATWRPIDERRVGPVTLRVLENPAPAKVFDDLVSRLLPAGGSTPTASASLVIRNEEQPCIWAHGAVQTGLFAFGPGVPGLRFQCGGGAFAGVTVMPTLENIARRCIEVPPPGGTMAFRLRFSNVAFGTTIHGHHGLALHHERDGTGQPVTLTFKTDAGELGGDTHIDKDGWKPFAIDTHDLVGKTADLIVEVTSRQGNRQYCFEADTR